MDHISMKLYADEKIRNARRVADIQREIDNAFKGDKDSKNIARSLLTAMRGWLLKIAAIRPVKKEEAATPIES